VNWLFAVQHIPTEVDLPEQSLLAALLVQLLMPIRRQMWYQLGALALLLLAAPFGQGDDVQAPILSLWLCLCSRLILFPGLLLVWILVALFRI
jgi:hypothetical protein